MNTPLIQWIAAALFGVALLHTFSVKFFERLSHRYPRHAGLFHLLGEVEVVFGFWAMVLIVAMALAVGGPQALQYAESRNYTEPLFVFVVMVIAASRPVLRTVVAIVHTLAKLAPVPTPLATAWLGLAAVPLLGSLITEPAAMTIAALMLAPQIFRAGVPERLKYLALGVLFVNVSIGGTLTSYAAPPVLMVAATWGWDSAFMLTTFGWKAALAVLVNATACALALRRHLPSAEALQAGQEAADQRPVPVSVAAVHIALLAGVVLFAHHPVVFLGIFLMSRSSSKRHCWWASSWRGWWCWAACSNGGCNPSSRGWSPWPCSQAPWASPPSRTTPHSPTWARSSRASRLPPNTCWWPVPWQAAASP